MKLTQKEVRKLELLIKGLGFSVSSGGYYINQETVVSYDDITLIDLLKRILREATVE